METKGATPSDSDRKHDGEIEAFFKAMHDERFDAVIHMQGDGKSVNPFINRFNSPLTVGMRNAPAETLDRSIPYVHYQSEILRNLEIARLIGASTTVKNSAQFLCAAKGDESMVCFD